MKKVKVKFPDGSIGEVDEKDLPAALQSGAVRITQQKVKFQDGSEADIDEDDVKGALTAGATLVKKKENSGPLSFKGRNAKGQLLANFKNDPNWKPAPEPVKTVGSKPPTKSVFDLPDNVMFTPEMLDSQEREELAQRKATTPVPTLPNDTEIIKDIVASRQSDMAMRDRAKKFLVKDAANMDLQVDADNFPKVEEYFNEKKVASQTEIQNLLVDMEDLGAKWGENLYLNPDAQKKMKRIAELDTYVNELKKYSNVFIREQAAKQIKASDFTNYSDYLKAVGRKVNAVDNYEGVKKKEQSVLTGTEDLRSKDIRDKEDFNFELAGIETLQSNIINDLNEGKIDENTARGEMAKLYISNQTLEARYPEAAVDNLRKYLGDYITQKRKDKDGVLKQTWHNVVSAAPSEQEIITAIHDLRANDGVEITDEQEKALAKDPDKIPLTSMLGHVYKSTILKGAQTLNSMVGIDNEERKLEFRDPALYQPVQPGEIPMPVAVGEKNIVRMQPNPQAGQHADILSWATANSVSDVAGTIASYVGLNKVFGVVASKLLGGVAGAETVGMTVNAAGELKPITALTAAQTNLASNILSSTYLNYYDKLEAGKDLTDDPTNQKAYALSSSIITGLVFAEINPGRILSGVSSAEEKEMGQKFIEKLMQGKGNLEPEKLRSFFSDWAVNTAKDLGHNLSLVKANQIADIALDKLTNKDALKDRSVMDEMFGALPADIISFLPFSAIAGYKQANANTGIRNAIRMAMTDPVRFESDMLNNVETGKISPQDAAQKMTYVKGLLNTYRSGDMNTAKLLSLTPEKRFEYANNLLHENAINFKISKMTDDLQIAEERKKIIALQEERKTLLNETQQPAAKSESTESTDETNKPNTQGTPATKNKAEKVEVVDVPMADIIGGIGTYKGIKGDFTKEGQRLIFTEENGVRSHDIGNVNEIKDQKTSEFDIQYTPSKVEVTDNGTLSVNGESFVASKEDNPLSTVKKDAEGNILSIVVRGEKTGEKKMFKGSVAEDIAYQLHLKEITKDNETATKFEEYINTPEVAPVIHEGLSEVAKTETTGNNGKVQPSTKESEIINSLEGRKEVPPFELTAMKADPISALQNIADQALGIGRDAQTGERLPLHENAPEPQLEATIRKYGKEVVDKAIEMFPAEVKGKDIVVDDIHAAATKAGVDINTDEFKAKSKELTGEEHLDKMNAEQLGKMNDYLKSFGEKEQVKVKPISDRVKKKFDKIKNKEPEPAVVKPVKEAVPVKEEVKPPAEVKEPSTGVFNVPIADISTNEKEYQGRKNKFSERSAKNVAENYDPNKLDPIIIYKHPDGKTYVLSGHSRFEGMSRRGEKTIPARYFEGTPAEAKDFALKSNKLGTLQTDIENAAFYRDKLKAGESYNALLSEAKENEQEGSAKRIVSLAHLNPAGKAMQALESLEKGEGDTKNNILNIAQKIGDIRSKNDHLTDAHENELFDYMVSDKDNIPSDKDIANQNNTLNRSINATKFTPEEPLNLERLVPKSENRIQWEKEKKELELEQSELKKLVNPSKATGWTGLKEKAIATLTKGDNTPEVIDRAVENFDNNTDGVKDNYQKQLEQKRGELNSVSDKLAKHLLREKDLIEGDKNQQSLFAIKEKADADLQQMKEIVRDIQNEYAEKDEPITLDDIKAIAKTELGNDYNEQLVEEAYHEAGKESRAFKRATAIQNELAKRVQEFTGSETIVLPNSDALLTKAEELGNVEFAYQKTYTIGADGKGNVQLKLYETPSRQFNKEGKITEIKNFSTLAGAEHYAEQSGAINLYDYQSGKILPTAGRDIGLSGRATSTVQGEKEAQKTQPTYMRSPQGEILGFTHDGKIYLNGEHLNPNTPVHEAGHIWTEVAKVKMPAVYKRGIELVNGSMYLKNVKANEFYQQEANKLPKDQRRAYYEHEALAAAIGDKGAQFITEARRKSFVDWAKDLWNNIAKAVGFKDVTAKELQDMTLEDFAKRAAADILKGKEKVVDETPPPAEPVKEEPVAPKPGEPVLVSHEGMQNLADDFGLTDVTSREHQSDLQDKENAAATAKEWHDNGTYAENIDRLITNIEAGKGSNPVEKNILQQHIANVREEAANIKNVYSKEYDQKINELERLKKAGALLKSTAGATLRDTTIFSDADPTMADWMAERKEVLEVDELTNGQKEEIQNIWNEYETNLKTADEKVSQAEQKIEELKAELATKTERQKRTYLRNKGQEALKEERGKIISNIKAKLEKFKEPPAPGTPVQSATPGAGITRQLIAIAPDVSKLVTNLIDSGIIKLADIVDNVHGTLVGAIPGLTKRDVHNIIAGDYNKKRPTLTALEYAKKDVIEEAKLINKLEKLQNGEPVGKDRNLRKRNQEITDLRNKIKEYRNYDQSARTPEQILNSIKKRNEARLKEIEKKIADKDFTTQKPKPPLDENKMLKQANPQLWKETMDAINNKEEAGHQFELLKRKDELAKRGILKKYVVDPIGKGITTAKAIKAGIDDSVTMVQLMMAVYSNPRSGLKAKWAAFKDINNTHFKRELAALHKSVYWDLIQKSGLDITEPQSFGKKEVEELFSGNMLDNNFKIPLTDKKLNPWTYTGGMFERIFTSMGNNLRLNLFYKRIAMLENQGKTFESHPEEYMGAARAINELTARGKVAKPLQGSMDAVSPIIWAPKMLASTLNTLGITDMVAPLVGRKGVYRSIPPQQARYLAWQMGKGIGMGIAVMGAFAMRGWGVDRDPRSNTFGNITSPDGNTKYNVFGRFGSLVKTIIQLAGGEKVDASGQEKDIDKSLGARGGVLWKFVRGKMTPAAGLFSDYWLNAKTNTFTKQPITLSGLPKDLLLPISLTDVKSSLEEDGSIALLTRFLPALEGIQVTDKRDYKTISSSLSSKTSEYLKERNVAEPYFNPKQIEIWERKDGKLEQKKLADFDEETQVKYEQVHSKIFEQELDRLKHTFVFKSEKGTIKLNSDDPTDVKIWVKKMEGDDMKKLVSVLSGKATEKTKQLLFKEYKK